MSGTVESDALLSLRSQLIELLQGGQAHRPFPEAVDEVASDLVGKRPLGLPHSVWELAEHIRITQADILGFSRDPDHVSPSWPEGHWPPSAEPPHPRAFADCLRAYERDLADLIALVRDPARGLFEPFAWGTGQNLLREAMLAADHTSYHTGQIVQVRRLLGAW